MKVDGGACENNLLMQLQADLLELEITRPRIIETTAAGTAMMAGLTTGIFSSEDQMLQSWSVDRTFKPQMSVEDRTRILGRWERGVESVRNYVLKI